MSKQQSSSRQCLPIMRNQRGVPYFALSFCWILWLVKHRLRLQAKQPESPLVFGTMQVEFFLGNWSIWPFRDPSSWPWNWIKQCLSAQWLVQPLRNGQVYPRRHAYDLTKFWRNSPLKFQICFSNQTTNCSYFKNDRTDWRITKQKCIDSILVQRSTSLMSMILYFPYQTLK